jgi:hypothetical protein
MTSSSHAEKKLVHSDLIITSEVIPFGVLLQGAKEMEIAVHNILAETYMSKIFLANNSIWPHPAPQ